MKNTVKFSDLTVFFWAHRPKIYYQLTVTPGQIYLHAFIPPASIDRYSLGRQTVFCAMIGLISSAQRLPLHSLELTFSFSETIG